MAKKKKKPSRKKKPKSDLLDEIDVDDVKPSRQRPEQYSDAERDEARYHFLAGTFRRSSDLCKALNIPGRTLYNWAKSGNWHAARQLVKSTKDELVRGHLSKNHAAIAASHYNSAEYLRKVAEIAILQELEAVSGGVPVNPKAMQAISQALDKAVAIQREAAGMDRHQNVEPEIRVTIEGAGLRAALRDQEDDDDDEDLPDVPAAKRDATP